MKKNSEKSKPCTTDSFPKTQEICKIVAACREAGVSRLTMGQLDILFGLVEAKFPSPYSFGATTTPVAEALGQTIQAQQKAEEASHEEQELDLKEQRVAEMLVTDPFEAEQLMELGELEPIGDSADGAEQG